MGSLNVGGINPRWFFGAGWVLAGVGLAMVAVHKEGQMKATLADYASVTCVKDSGQSLWLIPWVDQAA